LSLFSRISPINPCICSCFLGSWSSAPSSPASFFQFIYLGLLEVQAGWFGVLMHILFDFLIFSGVYSLPTHVLSCFQERRTIALIGLGQRQCWAIGTLLCLVSTCVSIWLCSIFCSSFSRFSIWCQFAVLPIVCFGYSELFLRSLPLRILLLFSLFLVGLIPSLYFLHLLVDAAKPPAYIN
jgi:hypothetical protein